MNGFRALELSGWTESADAYDSAFARLTSQSAAPLLDAVGAGPGIRLLDIACGPGYVASGAAQRGATTLGIDFSPTMIALARARYPDIAFREGDAEALDLPDASFDAATMAFGILHLDRPEQAIAEARRVLRPGGRFAFTVWAPPQEAVAFRMILDAVHEFGNPQVALPPGPPFFRFSEASVARDSLAAAGFVDAQVSIVPQTWHFAQATDLFEAMREGTVRTGALLKAQTPEALSRIGTAVAKAMSAYAADSAYRLPMPSVLAMARVPA